LLIKGKGILQMLGHVACGDLLFIRAWIMIN